MKITRKLRVCVKVIRGRVAEKAVVRVSCWWPTEMVTERTPRGLPRSVQGHALQLRPSTREGKRAGGWITAKLSLCSKGTSRRNVLVV